MNHNLKSIAMAGLTLCLIHSSWAETENPERTDRPHRETMLIKQLLEMSPEELAQMRQTIERIEKMSPEEKKQMQAKLEVFNKMDNEARDKLRQRYADIPKETRQAMRQRWAEMSPEERRALRQRLKGLSPEERADLMEAEGNLPSGRGEHRGPPAESTPSAREAGD